MNKKAQDILSKMTLEDKISLCNGADFWHSKAMEQYGIPAVTMSDGPHGVGLGKGLACEGWLGEAVRFWTSQQS